MIELPLWSRYLMAILYVIAGANHFLRPKVYLKIMPPYFPVPAFLIYLSGLFEIGSGLMLFPDATAVFGAWGVILLLIGVFPANVYMAQKGGATFKLPEWVVWVRLPLQLVLIYWAWLYTY